MRRQREGKWHAAKWPRVSGFEPGPAAERTVASPWIGNRSCFSFSRKKWRSWLVRHSKYENIPHSSAHSLPLKAATWLVFGKRYEFASHCFLRNRALRKGTTQIYFTDRSDSVHNWNEKGLKAKCPWNKQEVTIRAAKVKRGTWLITSIVNDSNFNETFTYFFNYF